MLEPWHLVVVGLAGALAGVVGALAVQAYAPPLRVRDRSRPGPPTPPTVGGDVTAVLAALRSGAVILDQDDRAVRANPAAYAFGLVRAGRLVHPVTRDLVSTARQDGGIHEREVDLPWGPGEAPGVQALRVRAAALPDGRMLVLADDETAARRLEEVRRDFVANVSHELKTPVGAVSLLAETVLDSADDPETVRRFTRQIGSEARRLAQLVREIIDLSRLQGRDPLIEVRLVSVDEILSEAIDRSSVEATALEVSLVVGDPSGLSVMGDRALLVTAVRNLVDNAVRYSEPGTRVGVGVAARDGFVRIAVVDQGIGIAPEDQSRVFERFYRVDPARSRQTGGTGLGLSIVKHVAAAHGGDVRVWSILGRGSTFTLRLPEAAEDAESTDAQEVPA